MSRQDSELEVHTGQKSIFFLFNLMHYYIGSNYPYFDHYQIDNLNTSFSVKFALCCPVRIYNKEKDMLHLILKGLI